MQQYKFETTCSQQLTERLKRTMPGGNTRTAVYYKPFPLALERGMGCRVWDADGNQFVDLVNNYASLVHGHSHPAISEALTMQLSRGTVFPAPSGKQADLAERICSRIASIERLRFTNSGTEAVMQSIRAARAFTGREQIVMASAGYHGSWEQVSVAARTGTSGIPHHVRELVHLVEYNNVESLESIMQLSGKNIAAILLEPVLGLGGIITGSREFFVAARKLADECGALLILDEIVTARLQLGGYQTILDVQPDLTTLGKFIGGGGLPIGAFGGRKAIMELFDPNRVNHLAHSGTFNGNLLTMAAGCVSLDLLTEAEINRINSLGTRMQTRLSEALAEHKLSGSVNACGSLLQLNLDPALLSMLHIEALNHGIYIAPRGSLNISTAMNEEVINQAGQCFSKSLERLVESGIQPKISQGVYT